MSFSSELRAAAIPFAAFAAALLITRPFANVLYGGDDWAYAWSVRQLVEHGRLIASDWSSAAAVPQVLFGALFAELFGLTRRVLNASTIVLAFAGVPILYALCRSFDLSRSVSALVTTVNVVGPLYLGFAGSFMSDMSYTVLLVAAMLASVMAIKSDSILVALLAGLIAALAFLGRQIAIVVPIAFAAALLVQAIAGAPSLRDYRRLLLQGLAGVGPLLLTFLVYRYFPDLVGGRTLAQTVNHAPADLLRRALDIRQVGERVVLTTYI